MQQLEFVVGGLDVAIWEYEDLIKMCATTEEDDFKFDHTFSRDANLSDLSDVLGRMLQERHYYLDSLEKLESVIRSPDIDDIPF